LIGGTTTEPDRDGNRGLKAREQAFLIVPANDGFLGAIFLSSIDIITAAVDLFGPDTHRVSSILLTGTFDKTWKDPCSVGEREGGDPGRGVPPVGGDVCWC
jgi:hypothetical protein